MKNSILMCLALLLAAPALTQADIVYSWDFGTAGNTEGWTGNNISGLTVAGDFITGTASSNDPQLLIGGLTLDVDPVAAEWTTVTFAVRETDESLAVVDFNPVGLIVQLNGGGASGLIVNSGFTSTDLGGGFFEVTADISAFGSSTITSLRVDPIGGAASNSNSETNGNFFEVDYIRVSDSLTAVPEPTSLAMLSTFGLGLLVRRRRPA